MSRIEGRSVKGTDTSTMALEKSQAMADHRKESPTWALNNTLVIRKAMCTDEFARCVREVEEEFKVAPGTFKIACKKFADTVSFLYCLIVVPKEVWLLSENHTIYASIDKDGLLSLFKVEMAEDRFCGES